VKERIAPVEHYRKSRADGAQDQMLDRASARGLAGSTTGSIGERLEADRPFCTLYPSFAPCGASRSGRRRRRPLPKTSWRGSSAGTFRSIEGVKAEKPTVKESRKNWTLPGNRAGPPRAPSAHMGFCPAGFLACAGLRW
jgi:hypothetical protein